MAKGHLSTAPGEQKETGGLETECGPGPKTEGTLYDRLEMLAAFAFLGKRAFMDGGYTPEGWEDYLSEIDCPFDIERLTERAFEGLLKLACEAWQTLSNPKDSIRGQLIDRSQAAPVGGGE